MLEAVLVLTSVLIWAMLFTISVMPGCAAFAEFSPSSIVAQRVDAMGRLFSAKLHRLRTAAYTSDRGVRL